MTADNRASQDGWPDWLLKAWNTPFEDPGSFYPLANTALLITTLEGALTVSVDDWIIRGVKNEIYPCKPDVFAATYDLVPEATA